MHTLFIYYIYRVSVCTHFVYVEVALGVGEGIEDRVEFVEHFHNFHGALGIRVGRTILAKADNAGEHERYRVVAVKIQYNK